MGSPLMPPMGGLPTEPTAQMPSPMPQAPPPSNQTLPMSQEDFAAWQERINQARAVRKVVATWWDANLKAYAPPMNGDPDAYGQNLNPNRDFTLVERKKADLFYQKPDVFLIPSPLMVGSEAILETHQTIVNEALGPDGVNAKLLVHQALFDVLCPAGTGWTVMGYDQAAIDTPMTHPVTQQPMTVPVPIYEACYWRSVSPKQGLIPHEFRSTQWDDAPWLGYDFEIPIRTAKRRGWVPDDYSGDDPDPELHFNVGIDDQATDSVVRGSLIFYKSSLYRDEVVHPQHYTMLVIVEGNDQGPAEHKDCPYQTLQNGTLTPDSMQGNPIHPLTIRTLTDSPYVASDCTISRPLSNELMTFRRQMVETRDATIPRNLYNTDVLPTDALMKAVRAPIGGMIGVPGDAFAGDGAIKPLQTGTYPRENLDFNALIDNDIARTHAIDASQSGADSGGDKTATEEQLKQSNVNARLGFERGIVLDWYCKGVTKYSSLIQRFYSLQQATQIVGPQAAQAWDNWRKKVPATLAFSALPDSTLRNDLAYERKRWRDEYSFFAPDPQINRSELLKFILPKLGYPQRVFNPQPPQKQAESTKPGISLKGEDFNPMNPQFPIVIEIARQGGIQISEQAIAQAQGAAMNQMLMGQVAAQATPTEGKGEPQTEHPGAVTPQESLNKHSADLTGGMQGSGMKAPMGAGGMVQ